MFNIRINFSLILFLILALTFNSCSGDTTTATESTQTKPVETPVETEDLKVIYENYPQQELLQQYLKPYPDYLTDEIPVASVELRAAMAAYNARQYEAAIDTFPNFSRSPDLIGYNHLYKGISFLMAGKEHDAFMTFQLINSKYPTAFEVSEWYRAVCYLAYNNIYEARRKLASIVDKGTYGKEDAAELLDILPVK